LFQPLALARGQRGMAGGNARERQAQDALGMQPREARGDHATQRATDEMETVDVADLQKILERGCVVARIGLGRQHGARVPVTGGIPGDHAKVFGEVTKLVLPRSRRGTHAMQQHERRAAALLQVGEAPLAGGRNASIRCHQNPS
jgi:hypothetical protein